MPIARTRTARIVSEALRRNPIVVLIGPRQCGKTTLAREFLAESDLNYFDLEDPASLGRLDEPMTALRGLSGLVVIDEVQRRPDLFPVLRVLADRASNPARFLILGSASGALLQQSSESLAGRAEYVELGGFNLAEVRDDIESRLWVRGGFPRSYLATTQRASQAWRRSFVRTLLERDVPLAGARVPPNALRRFWFHVAHYHGQTWNQREAARALAVDEKTAGRYLDISCDALVVRRLAPWHANLAKRQVKSPKVYLRDSGLLHLLLGLESEKQLLEHPKVGASWEGYVIEQVLATEEHDEAYFWATHEGAEIDLVLARRGQLFGVEVKRADAPRMTPSIRHAIADLGLQRVAVVYPGEKRFPIAERVEAVPLTTLRDPGLLLPS